MNILRQRPRLPRSVIRPSIWRRRRYSLLAAAALLVALAADQRSRSGRVGTDRDRYHGVTTRVVKVVDGDTFDLAIPDRHQPTTRVRLWGVDTPEIAHGDQPSMHFGDEATSFAREQLLGKEVVIRLSPTDTRDKYERLLAYVHIPADDAMFNIMLLEEGLAYADWRFRHPFKDEFERAESAARARRAGLWSDVVETQWPAWRQRMAKQRQGR